MDDDELAPTITIECTTDKYTVDTKRLSSLARRVCELLHVEDYELNIQLVDSAEIHKLNREYRQIDRPTDVLAFPQVEWQEPRLISGKQETMKDSSPIKVLGDIIISLDEAAQNAQDIDHPLDQEVGFLVTHGVLHLCGHDHKEKDEEALMTSQQKIIMQDSAVQAVILQNFVKRIASHV